jgi:hypothetical protein
MDALDAAPKAAASGKSLKRRNITWLVATGIVDVVVLSVVAFHVPLDSLATKMAVIRSGLTALLPMPILVLSYLIPQSLKAQLVFWRWKNPLPGARAFSKHAPADPRIDLTALKKNVGPFPQTEEEQNATWYRLYKLVQSDVTVIESHQNFLLFRDIAAMSLFLVPTVPIVLLCMGAGKATALLSAVVFLVQYLATSLASRNNGIRFVQNVLAIHSTQKIGGRTRASPASRDKPANKVSST